ncbi:hypothetical protein GWK47_044140 [Chionoecetes opilio]|uniref:Uncharacterized protein n=1 Tax=Chionoecetes opilio TaxID=41210 RepID=A0A8J5CIX8_CHIOP|nr:hypothetical protein GWK47_044140 [Chionoecetes opilio]
MHVPPSLKAAQGAGETGRSTLRLTKTHRELEARKRRRPGTLQPPLPPTGRTQQQTQGRWRTTAACASGLLHQEELQEDFEGQVCDHCEMHTRRPLVHYLLSCPPRPLRPGPAPAAQPAGGGY